MTGPAAGGRGAAPPPWLAAAALRPPDLLHAPQLPASPHPALAGAIVIGLAFGVLTRALLLRLDEAPFPSHPHGRINYLFLGLVASVLGALAPAALLTADYTAGVFLAIGTGQFHSVRQIEREMLAALDDTALVPRGRPYIEGLSMMLETRNYLVMLTAMSATTGALVFGALGGGALGLAVGLGVTAAARAGASVGGVAAVEPAEVGRDAAGGVRVGGVRVMPRGAARAPEALPRALGLRLRPRDASARLTLAEPAQRQAILHNLAANLGLARAALPGGADPSGADGDPERRQALLPAAALDPDSGDLVVLFFPDVASMPAAVRVARSTPLLETVRHRHAGAGSGGESS